MWARRAALVGALLALPAAYAIGQGFTPWTQPDGTNLSGTVINCATGVGRQALPCGSDAIPVRVAPAIGAVAQPVSGTVAVSNLPATQPVSGSVAVSNFPVPAAPVPNRGVATTCTGAASLGTTSTLVCAAGTARSYIALQNQSDAATVYCNLMGGAATIGPPSRKLLPNASLVQGTAGGGFVSTAAISCLSTAAATPLSAEVLQ